MWQVNHMSTTFTRCPTTPNCHWTSLIDSSMHSATVSMSAQLIPSKVIKAIVCVYVFVCVCVCVCMHASMRACMCACRNVWICDSLLWYLFFYFLFVLRFLGLEVGSLLSFRMCFLRLPQFLKTQITVFHKFKFLEWVPGDAEDCFFLFRT